MKDQQIKIREVFIRALINSVPDQEAVSSKINDLQFFESNKMETIFEELAIESLGRIWFLTIIEDEIGLKIDNAELFFKENSQLTINEIIDLIIGGKLNIKNSLEESFHTNRTTPI